MTIIGGFSENLLNTEPWVSRALCAGVEDPDMFFPDVADSVSAFRSRMICESCPVNLEYAEYSIRTHQGHGIWGGFTEMERREIRRTGVIPPLRPRMCRRGLHELTPENVYPPGHRRVCRQCRNDAEARTRRRRMLRSVVA